MILDTTFLIDLQREFRKKKAGRARVFLEDHADTPFSISVISVTEFLEGFETINDGQPLLRNFTQLDVDSRVAALAATCRRDLRLSGNLIGDFDILIGATALSEDLPLVTDNPAHFSRIRGLKVIEY